MKTDVHWQAIFQVLLSEANLILEVLDSRNPLGTHNMAFEEFSKNNRPDIDIILILNKSDMVPKKVLAGWISYFQKQNYTIYDVSAKYNNGVFNLLDNLRHISKGQDMNMLIVGYPNTGKSSLIQALTKNQKKVGISSNAGFTRGITKIKLSSNVFLIDTPGIIPIDETDEKEIAIKACMVADKVEDPISVVDAIYKIIQKQKFEEHYGIKLEEATDDLEFDPVDDLIQKVGRKYGRLRTGGTVNEEEVAKIIIRDWQANRLKYYVLPPGWKEEANPNEPAINNDDQDILTQSGVQSGNESEHSYKPRRTKIHFKEQKK